MSGIITAPSRLDAARTMMKGPPRRRRRIGVILPRSLLRVCSPVEPAIGLLKELLVVFPF
jgi:hypothetical protein